MPKAVALLSGGLDSQLAVKMVLEQGIEVVGLYFKTPFFVPSPHVYSAAESLKVVLEIHDMTRPHLEMLKKPKYGYGKNMNPCIDCHAMMVRFSGKRMEEIGADFIITGEVLKQRPKSQNLNALRLVDLESGYSGLVLRPLSAKLLPPTIPETNGLIDRERLLDIQGRSRTRQIELAKRYGLTDYPSPAGGCILTDEAFSRRLRTLLEKEPQPSMPSLELLKVGRHFEFEDKTSLIIGRNRSENNEIERLADQKSVLVKVIGYAGPTGLLVPPRTSTDRQDVLDKLPEAAAIVARYGDAKNLLEVQATGIINGEEPVYFTVRPTKPESISALRRI